MKLHENVLGNSFLSVGIGVFFFVGLGLVIVYKDDLDEIGNSLTVLAITNPLVTIPLLILTAIWICLKVLR